MEQNELSKKATIVIALIGVLSVGAIISSVIALQKASLVEGFLRASAQPTNALVDLGPVSFVGFAGKPITTVVGSLNEAKTIKLRGHIMKDAKTAYEDVTASDAVEKTVIIDAKTQIYRVGKRNGNEAPLITTISPDQFKILSTGETYIAYYEAGEGKILNESSPATTLSIFSE